MRSIRLPSRPRGDFAAAEKAARGGLSEALAALRKLEFEQFGQVMWSMPDPQLPALSAVLPAMPPADIQKRWNGDSGPALLRKSMSFAEVLAGLPLSGARIADIGCGWGRMLRLMYYFTDPELVLGIDPWSESIGWAEKLPSPTLLSDAIPEKYDVAYQVDLAYSFSVLTHLSEEAALGLLNAARGLVTDEGSLVVTVRTIDFWPYAQSIGLVPDAQAMIDAVNERGFAFRPHARAHYGEAAVSVDYLSKIPGWKIASTKRVSNDQFQEAVVLRKA